MSRNLRQQLARAAFAFFSVAVASSIKTVCFDFEMLGASLIVSIFVSPSILLFVALDGWRPRAWLLRHAAFIFTLVPMTAYCIYVVLSPSLDGGVPAMVATAVLVSYLVQA